MRIEGQRARTGSGLPAGDRPYRWGALVIRVWTQRFARMGYVVTGLVPARIEVRPSKVARKLNTPEPRHLSCMDQWQTHGCELRPTHHDRNTEETIP